MMRQLPNHTPIGSPARREPADGNEAGLRVSLGFEPAWCVRRGGADFPRPCRTDRVYRYEQLARMKAELVGRFPEAVCWRPGNDRHLAAVSGTCGAYSAPHLFGIELFDRHCAGTQRR